MSDQSQMPEPRASKVVQDEYGKLCAVAGDKQYRVQAMKAELDDINQKLYALNSEFNASMLRERESKTHLESVKAPDAESQAEPTIPATEVQKIADETLL